MLSFRRRDLAILSFNPRDFLAQSLDFPPRRLRRAVMPHPFDKPFDGFHRAVPKVAFIIKHPSGARPSSEVLCPSTWQDSDPQVCLAFGVEIAKAVDGFCNFRSECAIEIGHPLPRRRPTRRGLTDCGTASVIVLPGYVDRGWRGSFGKSVHVIC